MPWYWCFGTQPDRDNQRRLDDVFAFEENMDRDIDDDQIGDCDSLSASTAGKSDLRFATQPALLMNVSLAYTIPLTLL